MRREIHSSSGFHSIFRHCHRLTIGKAAGRLALLVCVALIPLIIFDKPRGIAIITYVPQEPMQYRDIVEKFIKSAAGHVVTHYKGGVPIYMPEEACSGCPIFSVRAEYRQIGDVIAVSTITQNTIIRHSYTSHLVIGIISHDEIIIDENDKIKLLNSISDGMVL